MKNDHRFGFGPLRLLWLLLCFISLSRSALWAESKIVIDPRYIVSRDTKDTVIACGFDQKSIIKIFVEDATDSCIWDVPATMGTFETVRLAGNKNGDTILFSFAEAPVSGRIGVRIGSSTSTEIAKLYVKQIPKAANVKSITWDAPICQNLPTTFKIPVDANSYAPGTLNFRWTFMPRGIAEVSDGENNHVLNAKDDADFEYTRTFYSRSFGNGKVAVTPYTCDGRNGNNYRTNVTDKPLTPFIRIGLYDDDNKIHQLQRKSPNKPEQPGMTPSPPWLKSDKNPPICRSYKDYKTDWNQKNCILRTSQEDKSYYNYNPESGMVHLEFGNFEEWRSAGADTIKMPELYYSYHWSFNPEEFVAETEMMETWDVYKKEGFGLHKSRIALRVLEGTGGGKNKNYTVTLTVRCDTCIARGGSEADFTYTTSIELVRQDSILDFKDEKCPINFSMQAQGEVCAGQVARLRVSMDNDDDSRLCYEKSNATKWTFFMYGSASKWEEVMCDNPEPNVFCYQTTRTSEYSSEPGDTVYIVTAPTNACFRNLWRNKDINGVDENGAGSKIYVKNPPLRPYIIDPVYKTPVRGYYTEARVSALQKKNPDFKQEDEKATRILLCNFTSMQTTAWLNQYQRYGLYIPNDSLFNPEDDRDRYMFRVVDYDNKLIGSRSSIDYALEMRNAGSGKKDSSYVRLEAKRESRESLANNTFRLGFYSYNACGQGDTGIFFFKIIDTLTTSDIQDKRFSYEEWDTICEGTELRLYSSTKTMQVGYMDISTDKPWNMITTDRMDYDWKLPDTWKYIGGTDSTFEEISVEIGRTSGPVKLRFGNRCGYGSYMEMPVKVHPYVRVTIEGPSKPCQGDTVTYRFKRAENADEYQIEFPRFWSAVSHRYEPYDELSRLKDKDVVGEWVEVRAAVVPFHDKRVGWENGAQFPITVVGSKDKVPGVPGGCNFTLDDPKNIDSLVVGIKPHPVKPIIDGDFPKLLTKPIDTVCADKVYTFQVKDTVKVDDDIYFSWIFPNDKWVRSGNSKIYDTITFTTPDTSHLRSKIKVVANRNDCVGYNRSRGYPAESDTLEVNLLLMDALPIMVPADPNASAFANLLDVEEDGTVKELEKRPCEGDTVCYVLKKKQDLSSYYAQFDWRPLGGSDTEDTPFDEVDRTPLTSTDWKVLSQAPYHDTLKMVVGRAPMRLRAANVSLCDTSAYKEDTIRPVSKVIASGQVVAVRPDAHLCEYEAVTFTFDTVEHATHYVFHYPWRTLPDTLKLENRAADIASGHFTEADHRYKISFGDTLAYTAGKVYVEAYNKCGVRSNNDELTIASVLRRQEAPTLKQADFEDFVYDEAHIIGTDSVLDTLCLRHAMVLEASPADAAAAQTGGWKFFYKWGQTQSDATVTKFEKYTSSAWTDPDANSSDSLWTITKEVSPVTTTYLWLSSRHKTCERYGDTLIIALRNIDTTALKEGNAIENYIYDKVAEKDGKRVKIQTMPCAASGSEVAYYLDLASLDITGKSYYFRWRIDSTKAFENLYDATDKTMAGSKFVLKNVPADNNGDGEPDWTTLDTLKIKIPADVDSLEVQVVITNRCEEAQMPGFEIRTTNAISEQDVYIVKRVSDYICDQEKLTYKVFSLIPNGDKVDTLEGIKKAKRFIWYTPWHEKSDTVLAVAEKTFDTTYKPGTVYVVPFNGCGDGHRSDSVKVKQPDILQPPLRVQPFAALPGYNPADGLVERVADSTCLRTDHTMTVKASLQQSEVQAENQPQNTLVYQWAMSKGKRSALNVTKPDSSEVVLNIPDFADSLYILHVAARRSVCQRYGDSLHIEVLPMDTIRFMASAVEDSLPYDRFAVLTRGVIQDIYPTPPLDSILLTPCVGSAVTYSIKSNFHWSLVSSPAPSFSWNGGKTGTTPAGMLEGTTGWHCSDVGQLPGVIPIDKVGAAGDVFSLSVHAQNICGSSVSGPLNLRPQPLINPDDKPTFKSLSPVCENDTVWVEVNPVANATAYVWTAKFPKGTQKDTTALPKVGYAHYDVPDATVSVHAMNACGTGLESEIWDITPLLRIPSRPEATWFPGLPMRGDTVLDTLCINGNNLLSVKSTFTDEAANEGIYYNWQLLPKSKNAARLDPLPGHAPGGKFDGHDSILLVPDPLEIAQGGHIRLLAAARRKSCPNYWSDTLYIDITLTDFASVSALGRLIWYDPAVAGLVPTTPQMPFCPGAVVRVGVENASAAPAYHWTFPDDTWHFADGFTDTTGSVIDVMVGQGSGRIYVVPMTDADNRRCQYNSDTTTHLSSDLITLKESLKAREFKRIGQNSFTSSPCAGTPTTYEVMPPSTEDNVQGLHHYRWEFPKGWLVYEEDGVTLTAGNTYETKTLTQLCRVLPSADTGKVRVYAFSVCDAAATPPSYSRSKETEEKVTPIDTARLEVIADKTVCKDSTLTMEVKALNSLTYATAYDLSVRYFGGSDAAVITNPSNPVEISFPKTPDSTLMEVKWLSSDSVNIIFTPRNIRGCPNNVQPVVYALRADTVPDIKGAILGASRVCMGALEVFEAQTTNIDTAITKVYYRWEVPSEGGWEIVKGADSAVVVIRVGAYEDAELKQTIRCYPRALCGTGTPFEHELTLNPPADFNGSITAAYANADGTDGTALNSGDRPCIGSDLNFTLTHSDKPADATIKYVWETPLDWTRLPVGAPADSTEKAAFSALRAGADTMRVRFLNLSDPKSCGLSRALQYPLFIRDFAPRARLTRPPYPCESRTEIDFVVVPDEEIDEATWTAPANDPAAEADYIATPITDDGSRIIRNHLNLKKSDNSAFGLQRFYISIRTTNVCGWRDTLIQVRPVSPISALSSDSLHVSHYCVGDSAYAYAGIPSEYNGQGVEYRWDWEPDTALVRLLDSIVYKDDIPGGDEKVVWMRFTDVSDTTTVRFYTGNDCVAEFPPIAIRTAPHIYTIEAKAGADTALYAQENISLSVVATQFGSPADYTYLWQPKYRVKKQVSESGDTTYATKGLYMRREYFNVTSTERVDTAQPFYARPSACQSHDTVMIFVDSTFTVISSPIDTACVDAPYTLSVYPYGGNTDSYRFDWYRWVDSTYELIPDAGNTSSLTLETVDTALIRFMVIGRDAMVVTSEDSTYQYRYDPDNNEITDSVLVPIIHTFSQIDTQYIELRSFTVGGRIITPGKESIEVPLGTMVHFSAEAVGGSGQYRYRWETNPAGKMDSPDSTLSQAVTRRIYDNCEVLLTIYDTLTGCSTLLKVNIDLNDDLGGIPNTFTPNGDGKNDVFMPGTDLIIFNRFGEEIYRTTEAQEGWDGTHKGKVVAPGDYLFVLTLKRNDREYTKRGTVTVITAPIR